jgi:hypothetical protein
MFWQYKTLFTQVIFYNALFQATFYGLPVFLVFCLGFTISSSFSYTTSREEYIILFPLPLPSLLFLTLFLSTFPTRQGRLSSCVIGRGDKPA